MNTSILIETGKDERGYPVRVSVPLMKVCEPCEGTGRAFYRGRTKIVRCSECYGWGTKLTQAGQAVVDTVRFFSRENPNEALKDEWE